MPRTQTLAHLATHMAVEPGDIVVTPSGLEGKLISTDWRYGTLECTDGGRSGRMTTSLSGLGLVFMDEVYLKPRPADGSPVRHSH